MTNKYTPGAVYGGRLTNVPLPSTNLNTTRTVIYVNPLATGLNDGSSWTNAFLLMSEAFSAVADNGVIYFRGLGQCPRSHL